MPQPRLRPRRAPLRGLAGRLATAAFVAAIAVAALLGHLPAWVAVLYGVVGLVCFLAYTLDKAAAVAGRWRISEATLILLGLAGGWPGALVAQETLRHKTAKASFRTLFWGSVLLNVGTLVALATLVPLKTTL